MRRSLLGARAGDRNAMATASAHILKDKQSSGHLMMLWTFPSPQLTIHLFLIFLRVPHRSRLLFFPNLSLESRRPLPSHDLLSADLA